MIYYMYFFVTNGSYHVAPQLLQALPEKKKGNLDEDYLNSNVVTFGSESTNLLIEDLTKITCY